MKRLQYIFVFVLLAIPGIANSANPSASRERLLMDFGWKFHLGNDWGIGQGLSKAGAGYGPASMDYSDASWRQVQLPHDWAIELPFDAKADGSHGFKALGSAFPQNSVSWYRRTFNLAKDDANRRLWLEFDGVFRDCTVFVNGWFVGHHESGYTSFRYDITDVAKFGEGNLVAVRVDATQPEGWFYEGAGIYRHVWLVKTAPVAIAPDGIFVTSSFTKNTPTGPAKVNVQTELRNAQSTPASAVVEWQVLAPDGKVRARGRKLARVSGAATTTIRYEGTVDKPELWSPEAPKLYQLVTTVVEGGKTIDRIETSFGIRTVAFDAQKGFLLNGHPYVIKGTCNHQDHAGVGAAMPDQLQDFRIARLKEMGSNAYRTSHNPPTPELLEACDRLGMLVMDENRLLGSDAANSENLESLVKRDRNHPSVFIWSIANEEWNTQGTPAGKRVGAAMQAEIRRLDPTRPVTYAAPVAMSSPASTRPSRCVAGTTTLAKMPTPTMRPIRNSPTLGPNRAAQWAPAASTPTIPCVATSAPTMTMPRTGRTARMTGGPSTTPAPGFRAEWCGRDSTTGASRRPTTGPASIRTLASLIPAGSPRTISGTTARGGRTGRCCTCFRTGTGQAKKGRRSRSVRSAIATRSNSS
jgi:beta-galactosidase